MWLVFSFLKSRGVCNYPLHQHTLFAPQILPVKNGQDKIDQCGQLWSYLAHTVKAATLPWQFFAPCLLFSKRAHGIKDGVGAPVPPLVCFWPWHVQPSTSVLFSRGKHGFLTRLLCIENKPHLCFPHHQTALWHLHAPVPCIFAIGDAQEVISSPTLQTGPEAAAVQPHLGGCWKCRLSGLPQILSFESAFKQGPRGSRFLMIVPPCLSLSSWRLLLTVQAARTASNGIVTVQWFIDII